MGMDHIQIRNGSSEPIPIVVDSSNNGDLERGAHWPELLPELLAEIASRLPFMEDFVAFREVCKPWRAAAAKDAFKGSSKTPFLMLAEKDGGGSDDRQLFSLSRNAVWRTMPFPWLKNKRCLGAGFGWVVTVVAVDGEVSLVKLSSGAKIQLPCLTTFPGMSGILLPENKYRYIQRAILSVDPSRTSDFVLMVLAPNAGLGYWRLGSTEWSLVDCPRPRIFFYNIGYYKGRMVDIDFWGNVRMRDPATADFTKSECVLSFNSERSLLHMRPYIVESSSGELLLIFRCNCKKYEYGLNGFQTKFRAVRVDVVTGKFEIMEGGIGRDAIFVGENAAVAVDAGDFPGVIKPNCVYYTDDCFDVYWNPNAKLIIDTGEGGDITIENIGGGRDMGIYSFEDGTIQRFPIEQSLSYVCPPLWIFPSF